MGVKAGSDASGGMMGGMGKMMEGMHGPPPKELYPSLMELPELSPEKRAEIEQQADERMKAGSGRLSHAVEKLHAAGRHREALPLVDRMLSLVPSFESSTSRWIPSPPTSAAISASPTYRQAWDRWASAFVRPSAAGRCRLFYALTEFRAATPLWAT